MQEYALAQHPLYMNETLYYKFDTFLIIFYEFDIGVSHYSLSLSEDKFWNFKNLICDESNFINLFNEP